LIQDQEPGYSVSSHVFLNTRADVDPRTSIVAETVAEGKGSEGSLVLFIYILNFFDEIIIYLSSF